MIGLGKKYYTGEEYPAPRERVKEKSMNDRQIEKAAKEALRDIVDHLRLDQSNKRSAFLLSYIEAAIRRNM